MRNLIRSFFASLQHFLRHLPRVVVGVQQVVRLFAKRRAKIVAIERLDVRILVREAQQLVLIEPPENAAAILRQLHAVVNGLTAAAGAAAGTLNFSTWTLAFFISL